MSRWQDNTETTTRSGLRVKIYNVNAGGSFPIHGAVYAQGLWIAKQWQADGKLFGDYKEHADDLMPLPPRKLVVESRITGGEFVDKEEVEKLEEFVKELEGLPVRLTVEEIL